MTALKPDWSSDGTTIAFARDNGTIWTVLAAGGAPIKILDNADAGEPVWTPYATASPTTTPPVETGPPNTGPVNPGQGCHRAGMPRLDGASRHVRRRARLRTSPRLLHLPPLQGTHRLPPQGAGRLRQGARHSPLSDDHEQQAARPLYQLRADRLAMTLDLLSVASDARLIGAERWLGSRLIAPAASADLAPDRRVSPMYPNVGDTVTVTMGGTDSNLSHRLDVYSETPGRAHCAAWPSEAARATAHLFVHQTFGPGPYTLEGTADPLRDERLHERQGGTRPCATRC
jgi:hypothetical protein